LGYWHESGILHTESWGPAQGHSIIEEDLKQSHFKKKNEMRKFSYLFVRLSILIQTGIAGAQESYPLMEKN